jgi:catalase
VTVGDKTALFENAARTMGDVPREIKVRHIGNCLKADPVDGNGAVKAARIPISEVSKNT